MRRNQTTTPPYFYASVEVDGKTETMRVLKDVLEGKPIWSEDNAISIRKHLEGQGMTNIGKVEFISF